MLKISKSWIDLSAWKWVPDINHSPRIAVSTSNYKNCAFSWNTTLAEVLGTWSWGEERCWTDEEFSQEIDPHLRSNSSNSWQQIEVQTYNGSGRKRKLLNKYQPLSSLCPEAQHRWREDVTRSQFEELFRFRLGTDKRIWGIRVEHHFFLVWYERRHHICPPDND